VNNFTNSTYIQVNNTVLLRFVCPFKYLPFWFPHFHILKIITY